VNAPQPEVTPESRGSSAVVACLYLLAFAALAASVVGAAVLLNVLGVTSWPSPEAKVRADMRVIGAAVTQFRKDTGRDPETMTCLRERPFYANGWAGPYLFRDPLLDPWGNE
jgi:hypothetical protein